MSEIDAFRPSTVVRIALARSASSSELRAAIERALVERKRGAHVVIANDNGEEWSPSEAFVEAWSRKLAG